MASLAASRKADGLEGCPPRRGSLPAPPPGRVEAASCFPAWAGREELCSQPWAGQPDTWGERDQDLSCPRLRSENGVFLRSERVPLPPLLMLL